MMAVISDRSPAPTAFGGRDVIMFRGAVEGGDRRGRAIGLPTANVAIERAAACDGVWAGWVDHAGERHAAAISIGERPTFYGREGFRLLEAHLLDFQGDLYDDLLTVWLHVKLRDQHRFTSAVELIDQMHADVLAVRLWAGDDKPVPVELDLSVLELPLGRALIARVMA